MNKITIQRKKRGTKYPEVDKLPEGAQLVSGYAKTNGYSSVQHVYVKFDRGAKGLTYRIVSFQGQNFVIPKKK